MDGFQGGAFPQEKESVVPQSSLAATRRISVPVFLGLVRLADVLLILLAWMLATKLTEGGWDRIALMAAAPGLFVTAWGLERAGIYALARLRSWRFQLSSLAVPLICGAAVSGFYLLVLRQDTINPLTGPLAWVALSGLGLGVGRVALARLITAPSVAPRLRRTIAVFGANAMSQRFIERVQADRTSNDHVIGVFDDRRSRTAGIHAGVPVLGRMDDLLRTGRELQIDAIVVALPLSATGRISEVCDRLKAAVSDIYLTADVAGDRFATLGFGTIGHNPVIAVSRQPLDEWATVQKRVFDLAVGIAILVLIAPVLGLIALAIRIDSDGPVLFRQQRRGFNNNDFTVFKFRSMHHHLGDPAGRCQTIRNDPRVTNVGRVLRRLSLDELPQLFNVLRGDMSLVGPRPHALSTRAGDHLLEDAVADYAMRHRVKPGITGWAQVNGSRGAIRTELQLRQRVDRDLYYINHWSLLLDIRILFMTLNGKNHARNAF